MVIIFSSILSPFLFHPITHSHYTKTSTWVDPRTLCPCPLNEYDWESLPPGWEKFVDQYGDTYYVELVIGESNAEKKVDHEYL